MAMTTRAMRKFPVSVGDGEQCPTYVNVDGPEIVITPSSRERFCPFDEGKQGSCSKLDAYLPGLKEIILESGFYGLLSEYLQFLWYNEGLLSAKELVLGLSFNVTIIELF